MPLFCLCTDDDPADLRACVSGEDSTWTWREIDTRQVQGTPSRKPLPEIPEIPIIPGPRRVLSDAERGRALPVWAICLSGRSMVTAA